MATLKHINSKNADYGAAEQYLLFEHDEFTMKPVLDETGRLIPREDYRLSTLNCDGEDFAVACMRANLRYQKNQRREDVKSHHYIISFDPRDGPDNGLTVDRAQALGEQFCKEHFPGHQALVCTHPDGHNHSGNIHVHIVINSLRIEEVPFLPYMDRPADTKVGCKHRCTDAALRYFKSEVMEMCHREGLYQIDLLNGSKNRVTDREYWAQKKGQAALDKQNAPMIADSITPRQTKFETNKEKLRQTLRKALATAASFDEFSSLLLQEGVTVKESRGRLSYLTPDRTKPITARKLGDDFDRAAVFAVLEQNAARAAEAPARSPDPPRTIKDRLQVARAEIAAPKQDGVQRLSYYSPSTAFSATLTPSLTDFNTDTQLNATCTFNYHNNDTGADNTSPPRSVGNYTVTATIKINGTDYVMSKDFQVAEGKMVFNDYQQFSLTPKGGVEGDTITIAFTPKMGESVEALTVTGDNTSLSLGNGITDNGDNTYTFTMPNENVTIGATFNFPANSNFTQDGNTYIIKNADGWDYFCQIMQYDKKSFMAHPSSCALRIDFHPESAL